MRSGSSILPIAIARTFRKSMRQVERGADCFFGVILQGARKSKNGNNSFAVGCMQIRAGIAQEFSGAGSKFLTRLRYHTGVVVIRQVVFVGQIADDDTSLENARPTVEIDLARAQPPNFAARKFAVEQTQRNASAFLPGKFQVSQRPAVAESDRNDWRQRSKENVIERANPA